MTTYDRTPDLFAHYDAQLAYWREYHRYRSPDQERPSLDALRRRHGVTHDEAAKLAAMDHPPRRPRSLTHPTTRGAV